MAFLFTLKAPLRVREIREQTEQQALRKLVAEMASLGAEIDSLDARVEKASRELCHDSLAGLSGAELHFHAARESADRERRKALAEKQKELAQAQQKQQARYLQAHQQREILSNLREQQRAAYDLEQARWAQREIDEIFLFRHGLGESEADGPPPVKLDPTGS